MKKNYRVVVSYEIEVQAEDVADAVTAAKQRVGVGAFSLSIPLEIKPAAEVVQ